MLSKLTSWLVPGKKNGVANGNATSAYSATRPVAIHWLISIQCDRQSTWPLDATSIGVIERGVAKRFASEFGPSVLLPLPNCRDVSAYADAIVEGFEAADMPVTATGILCFVACPRGTLEVTGAFVTLAQSIQKELQRRDHDRWTLGFVASFHAGVSSMDWEESGSGNASREGHFEGSRSPLVMSFSAGIPHHRISVDEAFQAALSLIGTAPQAALTAASLALYEVTRTLYLEYSRRTAVVSFSSALGGGGKRPSGCVLDMAPTSPHSGSQSPVQKRPSLSGYAAIDSEELKPAEVTCVSTHDLSQLPMETLKALRVVVFNLTLSENSKYLAINHTTARYEKVIGQFPAAEAVILNVGFVPFSENEHVECMKILPALVPFLHPEWKRTITVIDRLAPPA